MAKKYVTRCIVKKDHKEYPKGSIIESLTEDEIERGLNEQWLEVFGNDEEPASASTASASKPAKSVEQMNKTELLAKADELKIKVDETLTKAELVQKITEAPSAKANPDDT